MTQLGRHDAISNSCVNPKIIPSLVKPPSHRVDTQQSYIGSQLLRLPVWQSRCSLGILPLKVPESVREFPLA